jgi:hypothetical protein
VEDRLVGHFAAVFARTPVGSAAESGAPDVP